MKGYEPKHARCYCVAVAAGVATVVGGVATAASAGYSAYQSSKTGKAGEGGAPGDLYGSKIDPTEYTSTVNLPSFNAVAGSGDYLAMLPDLRRISGQVTQDGIRLREKIMPGSSEIMADASGILRSLAAGNVSKDVVDRTNQLVAERSGGAFDPSSPASYAGGTSQAVSDFSRSIGRTSAENMDRFLTAAPTWEALADQFAFTPDEALGGAIQLLNSRYNYELQKAGVEMEVDRDRYAATANINRTLAAPNPQVVGARNDALLQQAIQGISGGDGNYLTSIGGVVSGLQGMISGYGGIKTATTSPVPGVSKSAYTASMGATPYSP